jgi:hypothetical protein
MAHYLVELDGDQLEVLSGIVREAIKGADAEKLVELEGLLSVTCAGRPEIAGPTDRVGGVRSVAHQAWSFDLCPL